MDLDLSTNGSSIKECIGKLSTGKISWMILGYSGNRTLYIVETGDNSLEDMFDEFNGSEIMYGFASVIDPNTKLKKNIYIHWQGAGAQQVMKTKSMQHSNTIRDLFKPIHVTITARDSQDLDLKEVMQKVAAASGANYSVHNEKQQIYETKPVVKSQCNTANAIQEERRKELASLGSKNKDFSDNQKSNSAQINNSNKPILYSKPGVSKVGTNYEKINPEKEFKSLNIKQKTTYETPARIQSENNTAEKAREERQKELSRLSNRTFVDEGFQHVGTNYTKINPIAEIQQLKRQSVSTESDIPIKSPGANYTKCDPMDEIIRLRRESINTDDGSVFNPPSTYKKINPVSEIQELRKSHQVADQIEVTSSSVYKKINPAEEIKNLRAKSEFHFNEPATVASSYKKINPTEEIMSARINTDNSMTINNSNNSKISETKNSTHNKFEEKKPVQRQNSRGEQKSARSTFEKLHKSIDDHHFTDANNSPPYNKSPIIKEEKVENTKHEETKDFNKKYHSESNNIVTARNEEILEKKSHDEIKELKIENNITKSNNADTKSINLEKQDKKTKKAKAIFEYECQDSDEIDFDVGDIITDVEEIDDGWWIGCNKSGKRGMFPSNYVELMTSNDEPIDIDDDDQVDVNTTVNQANPNKDNADKPLTVVALYTYEALQDDEISFEEGDHVYNVSQIDEGWWQGETKNGDKGMFPSNYVMIP